MFMKKRTIVILVAATVLLNAAAIFGGVKLTEYFIEKNAAVSQFGYLSSMTDTGGDENADDVRESAGDVSEKELLARYSQLHALNGDFVGWIKIEGTEIDYPVMQTKDDPDFYLNHGFDKEYSIYGVPYVEEACTVGVSNNIVIYGHHMANGTMFHELDGYMSYDFWQEHKTITFNTLEETAQYEVMAAFHYDTYGDSFRFNSYTDMDQSAFAEFVNCVKAREIYDTGIEAVYGDELITLSTCDYSGYPDGRFVVVAKKVK